MYGEWKRSCRKFRQWKMLQQYEKYQKGSKAVQPKKEDLHLGDGAIRKRDET